MFVVVNSVSIADASEKAFEQWTETDDFEAAHEELFGAMFLDPEHVDRYESATTLEAP
jgi:heme-degrading monooxygenase HmoA